LGLDLHLLAVRAGRRGHGLERRDLLLARGTVKTFPESVKIVMTGMAIFLLIAAGGRRGGPAGRRRHDCSLEWPIGLSMRK
jgi:hypothetical protein